MLKRMMFWGLCSGVPACVAAVDGDPEADATSTGQSSAQTSTTTNDPAELSDSDTPAPPDTDTEGVQPTTTGVEFCQGTPHPGSDCCCFAYGPESSCNSEVLCDTIEVTCEKGDCWVLPGSEEALACASEALDAGKAGSISWQGAEQSLGGTFSMRAEFDGMGAATLIEVSTPWQNEPTTTSVEQGILSDPSRVWCPQQDEKGPRTFDCLRALVTLEDPNVCYMTRE